MTETDYIKNKVCMLFNSILARGYEVLKRDIILAMVPMHLDPYLGFLHSYFRFKPSLVYDLIEPFRVIAEDFVLSYHELLSQSSFEKVGKRVYLKRDEEIEFMKDWYDNYNNSHGGEFEMP